MCGIHSRLQAVYIVNSQCLKKACPINPNPCPFKKTLESLSESRM